MTSLTTETWPLSAVALYSGPGGSSMGLRAAGIERVIGVEWDDAATATARAAGFMVEHSDVRDLDPLAVLNYYYILNHRILLQGSPPCQGLSKAGKGKGREDVERLIGLLQLLSELTREDARGVIPVHLKMLTDESSDERSPLTYEVIRWIAEILPEYVMLEQVPAALPIWEAIAEVLRAWGYSVWTGNVQAEQFGVAQTRKRAILLASLEGEVSAPVPTHSKYHNRSPEKLDDGVPKWVSMAEALSWGMTDRPYLTIAPGTGAGGGPDPMVVGGSGARKVIRRERDEGRWIEQPVTHMGDVRSKNGCVRPLDAPAPTMTASMDNGNFQWVDREAVIAEVEPRVNNQSGTEFDLAWPADRPAPTIAGRELVTMPGANANRYNGSTKSRNDGIRVTVEEAGILQSFPADYPWQGNKTKQFEQVGNAVPPLLQAALTRTLLGK